MDPRPRVLVIDDDPAARRTLEALLDEEFTVSAVADADEAARALRQVSYEVIVCDHQLRAGWGLDFLSRLAHTHPGAVGILVTGHRERPEIQQALDRPGELRVVLKPYDPQALLRAVQTAANMARLRHATRKLGR